MNLLNTLATNEGFGMSGSVVVIGVASAATLATVALIGALSLVPASHELQGAAESAALAAVAISGQSDAAECEWARRLAIANGAILTACDCNESGICEVRTGRWQSGIWLETRARAGLN